MERTTEVVPAEEAIVRLAVALTAAAKNARALAHAFPEASDELRRASLCLVHAARAVTDRCRDLMSRRGRLHGGPLMDIKMKTTVTRSTFPDVGAVAREIRDSGNRHRAPSTGPDRRRARRFGRTLRTEGRRDSVDAV